MSSDSIADATPAASPRRHLWLVATFLIILLLGFLARPIVRAHLESLAVLDLVGGRPVPWLLRKSVGEPITTQNLTLPTANGPVAARLYIPVSHPNAPAIIVLHGVHYLGIDEPRLVAFSRALASCGLRVLTPELPSIKDYHVGANSIATIGDSALWMSAHDRNRPVGIMGLSFSGGLALLAAANPQYHPAIKFVAAIGSQDEMSRVAAYYRTGEDPRPDGTIERLPPHEYGPLVLEYEHLEDFIPAGQPEDTAPIRAVLRAHLYEEPAAEKSALAALTPAQLALARELMDTTSPATRALLAHSDSLHLAEMAAVSPHGHLHNLTTPVYLLHGAADNVIPSAETEWMAKELPASSLKAELITPVLSHINLDGANPTAMDQWQLIHFFALIIHAAETQ